MSDEPEATEATEPDATATDATEPDAAPAAGGELAVPDEASTPAVPDAAPVALASGEDPRVEARKTRFWLPLLIPVGAILAVAFVALNISRVFLASSEDSSTPAVIIAAGITVAILIGATAVAALPEIRTSSLVVGMAGVMVVIMLAGSLVLGASLPKSEATNAFVQPTGPAINTLEVDALPELKFQAKTFDVPGGINQIKYIDKGGSHTLVFDQNAVPGFELAVPDGLQAAKVDLTPGKTYTIYCTIPGHRAAGMQADIVVGAAGKVPEPGTKSPTSTVVPNSDTTQTTQPGTSPTSPASQSSTGGS